MTRQTTYETVQSKPLRVPRITYACDGCGGEISPGDMDDTFANELVISLNQDQYVSTTFRRDYCSACLEQRWQRICEAIGADPDAVGFDRTDED